MTTITQTIDIPASRKITLTVPETVPTGRAEVALCFTPAEKGERKFRIPIISWLEDRRIRKNCEAIDRACGLYNPPWPGDGVEIQRQLRAEWDRPWDKDWGYDG
jgi:hypothetical protein